MKIEQNIFTKIFTHKKLPFLELRYSSSSKKYKEHLHDTFSIGININGKSLYTNRNKSYDFDINMIAIINANYIHSCNVIDKEANKYYMLYLDEKWCYGIQKSIYDKIEGFKPFPKDILLDKKLYTEFLNLCDLLFGELNYIEKEKELIIFFTKLFSIHLKTSAIKIEDKVFEKILVYLKQNYKENISLHELSQKFKLNSFYIIRLFKSQINMTPHAYLLNLKINKAKEYLKKGHSLIDTALECGFSDQSHFHRNFLKIVATTPREYQINFIQ
jgi:AraC-like DNA-binding protein